MMPGVNEPNGHMACRTAFRIVASAIIRSLIVSIRSDPLSPHPSRYVCGGLTKIFSSFS